MGIDYFGKQVALDNDLYKFTMQQVVYHRFKDIPIEYTFKLRNYRKNTLNKFFDDVYIETKKMNETQFNNDDIEFLEKTGLFKKDYLDELRNFRFKDKVNLWMDFPNNNFNLTIRGSWFDTILYEVPVLAIVSEAFFDVQKPWLKEATNRLERKIKAIKKTNLKFMEFGTRRRSSFAFQKRVLMRMSEELPDNLVGTSNVYLARVNGLKPMGTMAHEFIQAMQGIVHPVDSQKHAFRVWQDEYRGKLGIALSDTLGMEKFFKDFDLYFAKLYDGARQDSGDPFVWGERLIKYYEHFGINPKTKTAIFSDGVNLDLAMKLQKRFGDRINVIFGIGTWLTNDCGIDPLNIVIKMTECNGRPVAKISDSPGKMMCKDDTYVKYLTEAIK